MGNAKLKVLIVEDDVRTASILRKAFTEEGFVADMVHDGLDAVTEGPGGRYDIVILDVNLPGMDGWEVLKELKQSDRQMPILMLTAQDAVEKRVKGLTLGADDYLTKPFAFAELLARTRAILRRTNSGPADILQFDDLKVDPQRHKVVRGCTPIAVSPKEILLLELLLRHCGDVLSRTFIADKVWDMTFDCDSNVVDVNIRRLRQKIDDPFPRKLIHTIRGRGYVIQ